MAKNQYELIKRKNHTNSILSEVKNKQCMQEIDNQRELNGTYHNYFPIEFLKTSKFNIKKVYNKNKKTKKINKIQLQQICHQSSQKSVQEEYQNARETKSMRRSVQSLKRRSSQIEIKLQQIIKYTEMYPGHQKYKNKSDIKSYFIQQDEDSTPKKITNRNSKRDSSRFKPAKRQQDDLLQPKKSQFKKRQCKINPDYLLKLVPSSQQIQEQLKSSCHISKKKEQRYCRYELLLKKKLDSKRIKYILAKSKDLCQQNTSSNKLSLDYIMQKNLKQHRSLIKERKTVGKISQIENTSKQFIQLMQKPLSFRRKNNEVTLDKQNALQFHNFIKGGTSIDQEIYGNYFHQRQISEYSDRFEIYRNIYQNIADFNKNLKIQPVKIQQQNLQNVFYLNETTKKSQNVQVKKQLKQAMKRIRMIGIQNNF